MAHTCETEYRMCETRVRVRVKGEGEGQTYHGECIIAMSHGVLVRSMLAKSLSSQACWRDEGFDAAYLG